MAAATFFDVGIDFQHVLTAISKQIYETPLAFLRENVQNAIDAIRIQALRQGIPPSDDSLCIDITVSGSDVRIRDNGIGMSAEDLRRYFWTIGASGKRNAEAQSAGCVGMFGIGGFANLGVCDRLVVVSQPESESCGTATSLSEEDIKKSGSSLPQVQAIPSGEAAPRGTLVLGHLREQANIPELERYIRDFVRFSSEQIRFNGVVISREALVPTKWETTTAIYQDSRQWNYDGISVGVRLFVDAGWTLFAIIDSLTVNGNETRVGGLIRFESGALDVFKRGFKLCATKVQNQIGFSGRLDCDLLTPTAGRDSLNAESMSLVNRLAVCLERAAVEAILDSPDLIAQHTRVFPYVIQNDLISRLGQVSVTLADGSELKLEDVKRKGIGGVGVFYGQHQKHALSQIMQARGNVVVLLPADRNKQRAVTRFLEKECNGKPFSGIVEVVERYDRLSRFELLFLSEVEKNITELYELKDIRLVPGRLTEDIPVYLSDERATNPVEISVDVRHPEITKLECLGMGPLLYSMISAFCREYLGAVLRKQSPKFFGSGAVNLGLLAKKRSELWILLRDDIQTITRHSERQVVRRSDVQTVRAGSTGGTATPAEPISDRKFKLLRIEGDEAFADITGYYIRVPDGAAKAYGDVIKQCDSRGSVWAGNRILLVASDGVSSAFQFEIRMDHAIVTKTDEGVSKIEGAAELKQPIQELGNGLYFPIPSSLESVLVPQGDGEVRIEVSSGEWIDLRTADAWSARVARQ